LRLENIAQTYSCRDGNVLSKDNTLRLNDEEVDELLHIVKSGLQRLLGDLVVASRTDGRGNATASNKLGGSFGESDN
jgi:hypothetical protein